MAVNGLIPRYFLYGEAPSDVERSFLHVETIERRSSANGWTIRLHAHPDHHQILYLTCGQGTVQLEHEAVRFGPLSVIVVPALVVHGYVFEPDSDGWVITVATSYLRTALEADDDLGAAFAGRGSFVRGELPFADDLADAFKALEREFIWSAPGRRVAIKAHLQRILVTMARFSADSLPVPAGARRKDTDIVIRYRELVEHEFRRQPGLTVVAHALGVTTARLNMACRAVTGRSALAVLHDRLLIEAKRDLLYTSKPLGELATSLGFSDAAYFNRFFSKRTGVTPGAFRSAGSTDAGPDAAA